MFWGLGVRDWIAKLVALTGWGPFGDSVLQGSETKSG